MSSTTSPPIHSAERAPGQPYRGRFAPSPTGPLHFGSLIAATASYLQARASGGEWLVRMEDIDPPREQPGAARHILQTLEQFGFEWDGEVWFQSRRSEAYRERLAALSAAGLTYPCTCSRRLVEEYRRRHAIDAPGYPGICRTNRFSAGHHQPPHAVRVRVEAGEVAFEDAIQGRIVQEVAQQVGDFVLHRADGLFAYQLAVVVDDAEQGISEVVRGSDLLDSTPRQIVLQRHLALPTPAYAHLPVITNAQGQKLSKQTHAPPIRPEEALPLLARTLRFLNQQPPEEITEGRLEDLWQWAIDHWNLAAVPRTLSRCETV